MPLGSQTREDLFFCLLVFCLPGFSWFSFISCCFGNLVLCIFSVCLVSIDPFVCILKIARGIQVLVKSNYCARQWNQRKGRKVAQSCPTLCDPMDCSLPGSSVHGIFQAIVLEWIAVSFSRGSSRPRDRTQVSHIVDRCFTVWATRGVLSETKNDNKWTLAQDRELSEV